MEGGENKEGLKLPQRIKIVAILIIIHYNNHARIFATIIPLIGIDAIYCLYYRESYDFRLRANIHTPLALY